MMKLQKGFTLLEVMIAVVVAGIALLGLAAAQLKSLQYATNSFNYTVSLIHAQNTIEQIWPHLCTLQKDNPDFFNDVAFKASLAPQIADYSLSLPASYANEMQVSISWQDERLTDNVINQITLNATYPDISGECP